MQYRFLHRFPHRLAALRSSVLIIGLVALAAIEVEQQVQAQVQAQTPLPVAEVKHEGPVEFEKDILPILRANCVACHNATEAESDLVVETPQALLAGGSEGPAVVPGNAAKSLLFQSAAHQVDSVMPPEDNDVGAKMLSPEQLGLIKLWIDQGAKGEVTGQSAPAKWNSLPPQVVPIYAVAISPDGQYAARGRANQISIYHVPSGRELGSLVDPELLDPKLDRQAGVAHLAMVQSLAFSPDGQILASGGYRTAKLWRRQPIRKIADLPATSHRVTAMVVSPDGKLCGMGQDSGTITIIDLASGETIRSCDGHSGPIGALLFSSDGKKLYSGSADKSIRTWNVADGSAAGQRDNEMPVTAIALVSGGSQIAVGSEDHTIRIWPLPESSTTDASKGEAGEAGEAGGLIGELKGHSAAITSLAIVDVTGTQIISGSKDGTLRQWNVADGKQIRQFSHDGPITAVAARPDGQRFASVGENGIGKLWDANDGKQLAETKGDFHMQLEIALVGRSVEVSRQQLEAKKAAVTKAEGDAKRTLEMIEKAIERKAVIDKELAELIEKTIKPVADLAAANKAVADQKAVVQKATEAAAGEAITPAPNELARQQKILEQLEEAAQAAAEVESKAQKAADRHRGWAADAALLIPLEQAAAKSAADKVTICKEELIAAEQHLAKSEVNFEAAMKTAAEPGKPNRTVAFSADGQQLAIADDDGNLHFYDANNGAAVDTINAHAMAVSAVCYTPHGELISAADESVARWNPNCQWNFERTIGDVDDASQIVSRVTALTFSPDGKLLATGSGEPSRSGQLKLWRVEDGAFVREVVNPHTDMILGLDFSPLGDRLVSASADRFVKVFLVADGSLVRAFEGHTHHVLGVAWKSDGQLIASGGADHAIKIWDPETGEQKRTIATHKKEVTSISFVGASDEILTSSADNEVRLHRAANGGGVRGFAGATDFMFSAAASDDGKAIVAGGQDGVLRVWEGTKGDPLYQFNSEK